jgi:hypothetical protein
MLFTGDFYQLRPVTGEAIYRKPTKFSSKEGQKIWLVINEYIELTESTRFKDDETPYMNQFLSGARKGEVNQVLLNRMNERVMTTVASAKKQAGPDAVWISHNNKDVNKFNDDDFKDKVKSGACHFRIQAFHTPTTQLIGRPDEIKNKELLKVHIKNGSPPYINLAIGSRVSCTKNLGTQIGTYACTSNAWPWPCCCCCCCCCCCGWLRWRWCWCWYSGKTLRVMALGRPKSGRWLAGGTRNARIRRFSSWSGSGSGSIL